MQKPCVSVAAAVKTPKIYLVAFFVLMLGDLLLFFGSHAANLLFRKDYPWEDGSIPLFVAACSFFSLTVWSAKSFIGVIMSFDLSQSIIHSKREIEDNSMSQMIGSLTVRKCGYKAEVEGYMNDMELIF